MKKVMQLSLLLLAFFLCNSCALIGTLFQPNLEQEKIDRFEAATGHELMKIYTKDHRLGYILDKGVFIKKVWGGNVLESATGQTIKLTYTKKDFDKLKIFLGDNFSAGPGLENIHHITVHLEDIHKFDLVDFQPLIEYMGKENLGLIKKNFVISMLKATKFSVVAYQKIQGDFGAEYRPYPMLKIGGGTGSTSKRGEENFGYNIFVGYKMYNGQEWWMQNFETAPKVEVRILHPQQDVVIDRVRSRVRGSISNYHMLNERYKNQMRLYIMVRDEYKDDWILQSKTTINTEGEFEGIVRLGSLEEGDGHRYSIAAFVTYFEINREVNSTIPILPFNMGKDILQLNRKDIFD